MPPTLLQFDPMGLIAAGIFFLVCGSAVYFLTRQAKPDPNEEEDVTDISIDHTKPWGHLKDDTNHKQKSA